MTEPTYTIDHNIHGARVECRSSQQIVWLKCQHGNTEFTFFVDLPTLLELRKEIDAAIMKQEKEWICEETKQ